MVFMDQEIGNSCFNLQGCSFGNRTTADVDLNGTVVYPRHITDFFSFAESTAKTQVWLYDIQKAPFKEGTIPLPCIDALAGGDGDTGGLFHFCIIFNVKGMYRLLIIKNTEILQSLCHLNGGNSISEGVHFNNNVHIISAGFPHGSNTIVNRT